jgi:fatty-acyl-CoA synthase
MSYWIDFLEKNAHVYDDKVAIFDQGTDRRITYAELNAEVDSCASLLQSHGVEKDNSVAFLAAHNCLEHVTLMLACAKIGALFVPLNFRLSNVEIEDVVNT